jgi:hypothetical protein
MLRRSVSSWMLQAESAICVTPFGRSRSQFPGVFIWFWSLVAAWLLTIRRSRELPTSSICELFLFGSPRGAAQCQTRTMPALYGN